MVSNPTRIVTKCAIIVNKLYTITPEILNPLLDSQKLVALYKRFYRLRLFRNNKYDRINYTAALRRRFTTHRIELRRDIFLKESKNPLLFSQIIERAVNTLAFVQNASLYRPSEPEENLGDSDRQIPTQESKLLSTILRVEAGMPLEVVSDFTYRWMDKIVNIDDDIESSAENRSSYKKKFAQKDEIMHYLGYRDYFTNLERINERHRLSL